MQNTGKDTRHYVTVIGYVVNAELGLSDWIVFDYFLKSRFASNSSSRIARHTKWVSTEGTIPDDFAVIAAETLERMWEPESYRWIELGTKQGETSGRSATLVESLD
jgi:hypothetical protein